MQTEACNHRYRSIGQLMAAKTPIGADNDEWIRKHATDAGLVVAAWGNDGSHLGRSRKLMDMIPDLHCLKINKTGEPAHPLYQPGSATLIELKPG